ncbi:MAG: TonB-dependent receptor, partial [Bryobacteraceae bacterium]|nr:TonB-dependent receptor [Bryobacteraceae bacterium]
MAATAFGQTASVTGRVTDASGAVVPGVKIEARNDATGVASSTESNDSGYYNLPQLLPGTYTITAEKSGFNTLRQTGLTLAVNQVARVDLTLQVGSVSESVEVAAEAVLLESESSTLGQLVQGAQVSNLPLLGRNPYALAGLVPGVRISAGANDLPVDQISTASASINGARGNQNEYLLDGAPNTAPAQNQPVVFANVDSVQEFKVETNAFSAEYGRAAGGVFNVVTKSGTNDLHFTLYEFLRNDKLNANDFFANRGNKPKAPFRFNQFGGTVGGPVVLPNLYDGRNRTFFFASTELVRFVQGVTFTGTVPRPEELAGDFSNTRNANNQLITIYDPLTTAPNPSGTGFIRQPFPGNRIPVDRMDPVARNIARYWPAPTSAGSGFTGVNNFSRTDSNRIEKNTWSARLDHSFNDNNRIFGRFSYDDSPWNRAPAYGKEFIASPSAGPQVFTRYNTVIEDTHVFSPTTLGTFRVSWARLANTRRPFSDGFDITTLGFPARLKSEIGDPAAFPAILVNGLSVTGSVPNVVVGGSLGATDVISFGMDTFTGQAAITKTLTRHTLKAGFETRILRFNTRQTNDQAIQFSFGPTFTQGPNPTASSATAGYGLATFLLGIAGGSITPSPALALQNTYYALYLQDDWKVTPRLTLNLGLRWDVEPARTERFNQLTNFDFNAR